MGYADLIRHLQGLPEAQQAEVFELVQHLVQKNQATQHKAGTLAQSSLAELMRSPILVDSFTPLSREEANER
jgi:hypothetical protein